VLLEGNRGKHSGRALIYQRRVRCRCSIAADPLRAASSSYTGWAKIKRRPVDKIVSIDEETVEIPIF